MMQITDLFFAPVYLMQARKLKRNVVRLPEASGERVGQIILQSASDKPSLSLMMLGDSSASGVGVMHQDEALIGQLLANLQENSTVSERFSTVDWQLHATTGHTSFDVLRRLYVLPKPQRPIDVMVIVVGVNDVTTGVSIHVWQQRLKEIIAIAKRKFAVDHLFFSALPPMQAFPALPKPLNNFVGHKAQALDNVLQQVCQHSHVHYVDVDFLTQATQHNQTVAEGFANDGFHPNALAYRLWGKHLATVICKRLMHD